MKLDGGGGIKFEILNKKKCKRIVPINLLTLELVLTRNKINLVAFLSDFLCVH